MKALLRKHGAHITVEQVSDRETAKAILDGNMPAYSLNVAEPTLTDLAEQMLWAAAAGDPEIVRMCLPYMKCKRDDPWWNYVLVHTALPGTLKLILGHGVDPDVIGGGGYTILHHLATAYAKDESRVTLATILLDAGASLSKRDPLLKSTPHCGLAAPWPRPSAYRMKPIAPACTTDLTQPRDEAGLSGWEPSLAFQSSSARGGASHGDHLEVADLHSLERGEILIVPPWVGGAGDEPVAAVVGQHHAIGLEGFQDHSRLRRKSACLVRRLEPHAHPHRGQVDVGLRAGKVPRGMHIRAAGMIDSESERVPHNAKPDDLIVAHQTGEDWQSGRVSRSPAGGSETV